MLERVKYAIAQWLHNFYQGPLPFTARRPWMPQYSRANQTGQMQLVGGVGTLFGIVDGLAEGVSGVDWCLYQKSASGVEEERTKYMHSHKALDLWNEPNPFYTQDEFIYAFQQHYDLVGEANIHVVKKGGVPGALWVLRPDRLAPVPDAETFQLGWEYKAPDGTTYQLENASVMRTRRPHPTDPYRGLGAVQAAMSAIDGLRFSNEWNARFFLNDATPGVVIEVPDELGDTEYKKAVERWGEMHKGMKEAHRPAFLHGGWKLGTQLTFTQRDMQFQELNILSREQIMEAYRYPKAMLGLVADSNRANSEMMEYSYAKHLLVPRLERMKKLLNGRYLPMFGSYSARILEFDYVNPVPSDEKLDAEVMKAKAEAYKVLVDSGVEPEDAANAVGLPKMRIVVTPSRSNLEDSPHETPYENRLRYRIRDEEDKVREQWEKELDTLVDQWSSVSEKQRLELATQIERMVDQDDIAKLHELKVDTNEAGEVLLAALVVMASIGAKDVTEVAAQQGLEIEPAEPSTDELTVLATTTAALLGAGLSVSAGREALRLFSPTSTGKAVSSGVTEHLSALSDSFLRDQLGGALWAAEGQGRYATMAAAPRADHYIANEVRDRNRCEPCKKIDGTKFYSLDSARNAYPMGGYHRCAGGVRCRGNYEPVWEH